MFTVLNQKFNGSNIVEITDGEFKGCQFVFGEVKFADEPNSDDTHTVSFDYMIANDYTVSNNEEFKQTLGDILIALVEVAVEQNELLMKGGR